MLKLDINLLWTVVNVLVMYAVLRKFLFKPVQDVIAKRQQMVDANLADAETSKKEAAETMNAAQEKLRNVDNEAAARREAYEKHMPSAAPKTSRKPSSFTAIATKTATFSYSPPQLRRR